MRNIPFRWEFLIFSFLVGSINYVGLIFDFM